jgi:hypothetical protein
MIRPVILADVLNGQGDWITTSFLVDTAADRTVFSNDVLRLLQLTPVESSDQLSGVGGTAESVVIETQIRFTKTDGEKVLFRGQFAGFCHHDAIEMSVLGRDILNLFAVIVDRPSDRICLVGGNHRYVIQA